MTRRAILATTAMLAFAAAAICYNLLNKHITGSSGVGWFEAGCSDESGPGRANCAKVLASPYSYVPPKWPDRPDNRARLPTAFLGLAYYSSIIVWLMGVGQPSFDRRWWHLLPLAVIGLGLAGSAYFLFIMYRVLDEWCPWCLVTHILNVLIAIGLVLMWPRRKSGARATPPVSPPSQGGEVARGAPGLQGAPVAPLCTPPFKGGAWRGSTDRPVASPSARSVVLTVLVIFLANYAHLNTLGLKTWRQKALAANAGYEAMLAAVNRIKGDSEKLLKNWQLSEKREIARRADDPVRTFGNGNQNQMLDVVVFSDFECPSCRRFAEFFEHRVPPLFDGHVRLTFKHYPIDQTCNPRAGQTMHKYACYGASLAEAARTLKGNDAFWKVHDYLYENRGELAGGRIRPEQIAELLGEQPSAFRDAPASADFADRIKQDVEQARTCEIRGTPSVFVEGKLVDMLAVTEIGFWDKLADYYWFNQRKPRPASTRLESPSATPGTPAPTNAP